MAIENTISCDFDPRSSIVKSVFDCRLPGVEYKLKKKLRKILEVDFKMANRNFAMTDRYLGY